MFYESLYQQNPDSFIALKWCVEFGVFPKKDSEAKYKVRFCKGVSCVGIIDSQREDEVGKEQISLARISTVQARYFIDTLIQFIPCFQL